MTVRYITDPRASIVHDPSDILVNTVNCVGVMGKGVALAFATRWPEIVGPYKNDCRLPYLKPGRCFLYGLPDMEGRPNHRRWAAFTTKDHWRNPSRIEWIESGLAMLVDAADVWRGDLERHSCSIAIPPLGCGNGGLDWREVEPLVLRYLGEFDLTIYGEKTT